MAVLAQQSECILAGGALVAILAEVPHQKVGLLLVVGPPEQALQRHNLCHTSKNLSHPYSATIWLQPLFNNTIANIVC